MGIRLTWTDNNFGEDGHRIYRSTSPMDAESLPAPYDEIGPNVELYDDGGVMEGETYYYRVSAYIGSSTEVVSEEIQITAGEFSIADLFANSETGGWYDPSDLSTLWQDEAGTLAVSSDGDPVARVDDKSGNGNNLTISESARRPLYKTDGTYHWLLFDGSNDRMSFPAGTIQTGNGARSTFMALTPLDAQGSTVYYLAVGDSNISDRQSWRIRHDSGNGAVRLEIQGSAAVGSTDFVDGDPHVIGAVTSGSTLDTAALYLDGAEDPQSTSGTATLETSSVSPSLGSKELDGSSYEGFANFRFYGWVQVNRALTATEISNLSGAMADLAGIPIS
ncbi:LamG domain-containing protein [Marinobacter sp. JSM 1782161]|uniref:LamG domain-containing protein n=1 Tax=Marinobacter sp. JSM 1782161 TaxID=2685906 RepID=UPI001402FE22|nr:LamG domain-containing protein [Marinobacter sp. JSM 1782161]